MVEAPSGVLEAGEEVLHPVPLPTGHLPLVESQQPGGPIHQDRGPVGGSLRVVGHGEDPHLEVLLVPLENL